MGQGSQELREAVWGDLPFIHICLIFLIQKYNKESRHRSICKQFSSGYNLRELVMCLRGTIIASMKDTRASLVVQWLRICLPIQGTRVWALIREDPTCRGATKPVHHNYWACAPEPASHNYWARELQLLKPTHLEPVLRNKEKPPQWEEACAPQPRVALAPHN